MFQETILQEQDSKVQGLQDEIEELSYKYQMLQAESQQKIEELEIRLKNYELEVRNLHFTYLYFYYFCVFCFFFVFFVLAVYMTVCMCVFVPSKTSLFLFPQFNIFRNQNCKTCVQNFILLVLCVLYITLYTKHTQIHTKKYNTWF